MLKEMDSDIYAVIVSTPDHTNAPASMLAMELNKPVYCRKLLTHHVAEASAMNKLAALLIQSGIIGKVHTVRAWSPKNWRFAK